MFQFFKTNKKKLIVALGICESSVQLAILKVVTEDQVSGSVLMHAGEAWQLVVNDEIVVDNGNHLSSMLRLQQQRAMQDTLNPCFGVTLTAAQITPKDCDDTVDQDRFLLLPPPATLTVVSGLPDASSGFLFNGLGCPVSNGHETNAEACGQSSVELQIDGVENRRICVQSEGYIRSGSCN